MEFTITIAGTGALLMHSARLSNPLDPVAKSMKRITGKRVKTDSDYEELARLEHMGSLYMDPDVGPYIPGENIQRCLVDAAKVTRSGVKVTRGVFISSDVNPLSYKGPRDVEGLRKDENFRMVTSAKVGMVRVMRCRPVFRAWRTQAMGIIDTSILSFDELGEIVTTAGTMIGLGDWRPRYGRFTGSVEKV